MALAYVGLASASLAVGRLRFDPARNRRLLLLGMALSGAGLVLMVRADVRLSFLFRVVHEIGDGADGRPRRCSRSRGSSRSGRSAAAPGCS